MKPRVKEVIVVEGRYDRNALLQAVDATVVETGGFSVFNDREKLAFLRRLAEKRGLILLTDPDGAGFVIRNHLKGAIPRQQLKQAYVPDIAGNLWIVQDALLFQQFAVTEISTLAVLRNRISAIVRRAGTVPCLRYPARDAKIN